MNYAGKEDREIRDEKIVEMRAKGITCAEIGRQFGLTRARVSQIYEQRQLAAESRRRLEKAMKAGGDRSSLRVDDLGLSGRSANGLKRGGVIHVGDLARMSAADLLRLKGVGRTSVDEIERALAGMGLRSNPGGGGPGAGGRRARAGRRRRRRPDEAAMRLSESQLERFRDDGYLFLPGLFSAAEMAPLRREMERIAGLEREEVLRDEAGELRLAMGMQDYSPIYDRLLRHPRLLGPAQSILGPEIYAHQFKIVAKEPFGKLDWPWHQDAASWRAYDGMPEPLAMNYAVFLDEVTEFNGPIAFIPGSHRDGVLDGGDTPLPGGKSPLRTLPRETVAKLAGERGIVAPKGPAGSAVFFSGCLAHASGPNIGPWTRYIVYITYNPVSNAIARPTRPDYYARRSGFAPLEPLADARPGSAAA